MFTVLAYFENLGAAAADSDVNAVSDQEWTQRNNHFIFTDEVRLLGTFVHAASVTRARLNVPSLNAYARHQLWPIHRSATIPSDPRLGDYRNFPLRLPQNEELAVEGSNDAGAGEDFWSYFWLGTSNWNMQLPSALQRFTARATYAITSVDSAWSPLGNLTFAENLRGGMYAVLGMNVFDANAMLARLVFPRGNTYGGRRMRPGCLVQNAVGDTPNPMFMGGLGLWGTFHSFEPPQVEILANNAAAHTGEVRLDLAYLGER